MLQLFLGQGLLAVSPMLATWCRHCFPPPRLDDMACPQLSPLGRAGAFLWSLGRLSHPTQQWCPPWWGRSAQQPKPKTAAKEIHSLAPQWQECIKSFSFNSSTNDPRSSPRLAFCLQQVLQVTMGSGIAFVWECCSYKLSGYFHTSDGVDSIWWGNSFHLVIIL